MTDDRTSRLAGQAIAITGAAQGIGEALARRCSQEGARVALVDLNPAVIEVAREIDANAFICDVANPDASVMTLDEIVRVLDGLDGLANVAAIHRNGDVQTLSDDDWNTVFAVNVEAPRRWIRAAMPHLLAGGGAIVNVASVSAMGANPDSIAYVASKHALLGMTRSVAVDFGRRGVRCNAVSPGTVETAFFSDYAVRNPEVAAGLLDKNYVGRFGEPWEIAALCSYLLSPESAFVNGANLAIDGGRLAGI